MKKVLLLILVLAINTVAFAQKNKANRTAKKSSLYVPRIDSIKQINAPANTNQQSSRKINAETDANGITSFTDSLKIKKQQHATIGFKTKTAKGYIGETEKNLGTNTKPQPANYDPTIEDSKTQNLSGVYDPIGVKPKNFNGAMADLDKAIKPKTIVKKTAVKNVSCQQNITAPKRVKLKPVVNQ